MEQKVIDVFAENLRFARKARGYSQALMAERLGIARSTYAGYETGKRSPDVEMFARLSEELFVSADELLGRYDYGTPNLIRQAKAEYYSEPRYSVEDYFALPKQGDYELIEGKLVKKNVSGYRHQIIAGQIFMQFYQDIRTHCKKCEVIPAPFCVILSRADGVVVPSLIFPWCADGSFCGTEAARERRIWWWKYCLLRIRNMIFSRSRAFTVNMGCVSTGSWIRSRNRS